jgi:hypothetical protein
MKVGGSNIHTTDEGVLRMTNSEERREADDGYTKVDKRRFRDEAGEAEAAGVVAEPASGVAGNEDPGESAEAYPAPPAEDSGGGGGAESLAEIGVYGLLRFFLGLLAQQAWVALGVQAAGGELRPNLPEAKVAIDTLAFMAEKLAADLDASEKRELDTLLANLRVNYIQRAG